MTGHRKSNYNNNVTYDGREVIRRIIKYILEGIAVSISAYFVGRGKLDSKEIIMIGITAALVFAILDMYTPVASFGARAGAGLALGYGTVAPGALYK